MAPLFGMKDLTLKLNSLLFERGTGRFGRQNQTRGLQWEEVQSSDHLQPLVLISAEQSPGPPNDLFLEVGRGS